MITKFKRCKESNRFVTQLSTGKFVACINSVEFLFPEVVGKDAIEVQFELEEFDGSLKIVGASKTKISNSAGIILSVGDKITDWEHGFLESNMLSFYKKNLSTVLVLTLST